MKRILLLLSILFLVAGCECFLPGGKVPEGNIIAHSGEETPAALVFDRIGAVDYFINELIRETMLHAPGMNVFVDADDKSSPEAKQIIRKTGEFSGITPTVNANGSFRLVSRRNNGAVWQMELFDAGGKSLWKRVVTLKN